MFYFLFLFLLITHIFCLFLVTIVDFQPNLTDGALDFPSKGGIISDKRWNDLICLTILMKEIVKSPP